MCNLAPYFVWHIGRTDDLVNPFAFGRLFDKGRQQRLKRMNTPTPGDSIRLS
jgi:hypothetical protein